MAFERKWPAVAPQLFTADGTTLGVATVANTRGFKVKAKAVISATGLPDLQIEIKRVLSANQVIVGPIGKPITAPSDISAYTVALGAFIYAEEQEKNSIPENDRDEATYDQEPTVAQRVVVVDQLGQYQNSLIPSSFDYIGAVYNSTSDVYTYKIGGSTGAVVGVITVAYTDSTKNSIQSVTRT